uniref:Bargin (Trinotate prediction) n=1 Tax=Henneguya salminicola TaxID=69463 RepID=A0A6G3MF36_HENSL
MIELKKCMTFGVNLKEHCKTFNVSLPIPLTILVKYLTDDELIKREGIFRLSATKTNLALIKEHLEKTGRIDFDACPLVVATLIKQYIRKLSGFIETSLFDAFRKVAAKPSSEFNEAAKELVDTLDENTKTLLIYLAHFIKYISLYYESNKMDLKNLSIVFGPTIFSCDDPSALDSQEILNYFIASFCEAIEEIYPNDNLFNEQSFNTYDEDRKDSIPEERSGLYVFEEIIENQEKDQ